MLSDVEADALTFSDSLATSLADKLSLLASLCASLVLALSDRLSLLVPLCSSLAD